METKLEKIAIIGAGIAGLSAAIMLENKDYAVQVYEASETIRGIGAGMGLASNAIKAFEYLGLKQEVTQVSKVLTDFAICDTDGKPLFSIDTNRIKQRFQAENYAAHRADLHRVLSSQISSDKIKVRKRLTAITVNTDGVSLLFNDNSTEAADYVIGADGVNSRVRQLFFPKAKPRYAGYWCWRGVVNLTDSVTDSSCAFWGKAGRFGITPLPGNRLYWFACVSGELTNSKLSSYGIKELQERFKAYPAVVRELLAASYDRNLISTPVMDIDPIKSFHIKRRVLLIGDAAHAATPNMGQGACMAVEDVAVLQDELKTHDFITASENYEKRRLSRTQYIITNSRKAGKIAQLNTKPAIKLRNALFRRLPSRLVHYPLNRLLEEDFIRP